jgi:signal transduction histidine kinase
VHAHGGTIEARRRPERGTRFEFTLPTAEPRT